MQRLKSIIEPLQQMHTQKRIYCMLRVAIDRMQTIAIRERESEKRVNRGRRRVNTQNIYLHLNVVVLLMLFCLIYML